MKPTLVVMAAGMGSRFGGLKQLEPLGESGEILLEYSVFDACHAGFGSVLFVVGETMREEFHARVGARMASVLPVSYVTQQLSNLPQGVAPPEGRQKPWGTGHAVMSCLGAVDGPFCVINADDFYGRDAFVQVAQFLRGVPGTTPYTCCMAGYAVENTLTEHGHVSRGVCSVDEVGRLLGVEEHIRLVPDGQTVRDLDTGEEIPFGTRVSMNFWGFPASILPEFERQFAAFLETRRGELDRAEFYLPQVVNTLLREGRATVSVLPTRARWYGMTYREDRDAVAAALRGMGYPANLWEI